MVAKEGVWTIWKLAIGMEKWVDTYCGKELIVIVVVMMMTVMMIGRSQGIVVGSLSISHGPDEFDREVMNRVLTKKVMLMFLLSSTSWACPSNCSLAPPTVSSGKTYLDQLDDLGE